MKKTIVTTLAVVALASGALAQGFINTATLGTAFSVQTNNPTTSTTGQMSSKTTQPFGYYFELLTSTNLTQSTSPLAAGWLDTGVSMTNGNAGVVNSFANIGVNNWAAGALQSFMLVGWSANTGYTSWSQFDAALIAGTVAGGTYTGESALGVGAAGAPSPGTPFHIFGAVNGANTPINSIMTLTEVVTVPEPTTLALAGLSGASLLLFRRRK